MPATRQEIGCAVELMAALRGVTQRVAQQATFEVRVSNVEAHIAKLLEENNKLATLAFSSDVVLESKDGIKVPAVKQTLIEASDVFVGMFSEHTVEGREGVVRTSASAEALRYVSRCVHTSGGGGGADTDTLLEVCELAERWQLPEVLKDAAAAFGDRLDFSTALKTLISADRHMEVGSDSAVWKDLLEDAAKAVALAMPAIAKAAEFKMLSIEAIAIVMSYLEETTIELANLEGGMELGVDGEWSKPVSWLEVKDSSETPPARGQQFRLTSSIKDGNVGFFLSSRFFSFPTFARGTLELTSPDGSHPWQRKMAKHFFFGRGKGQSIVVTEDTAASYTTNGRFQLSGRVVITKEQRQSETFNLWLVASGAIEEPLEPPAQLQFLREHVCGFDFSGADADTLIAKLEERGLSTEGKLKTLQIRLRDAMLTELPLSPALRQASTILATLSAFYFARAAANGSLFDLDAATMSQILSQQNLAAESEKQVLDHVLRWATYAGRTTEVIDKVMPLVRFPLISMIKPPAKLKELKARSKIVAELIAEAMKCQIEPMPSFSPAKNHALLPSMASNTEQPRTKRRRFCKEDEVPKIDAAAALVECVF